MKYRKILIFLMVFGFSLSQVGFSYGKDVTEEPFKVVGYYSGGLFNEPLEHLQMDKLTHIMYAFLIPNLDGTLVPLEKPAQLKALVQKAHAGDTKVFIALGGYSYQNIPVAPTFEQVAASAESRENFINNVLAFVKEYELDGVELDWEYPLLTSGQLFEDLVVEIGAALHQEGKEITAALNGAWSVTDGPEVSQLVTDQCLATFDFINVMSYDMNNDAHSPLWFAETSLDYWLYRGVSPEKIVLGMPLYARPSWLQYRDLVALDPENAYLDNVPAAGARLASHYNGLNTLREKTIAALRKGGGVMLFDVNEDTTDQYSVVTMIDTIVKEAQSMEKAAFAEKVTLIVDRRPMTFSVAENMGQPYIDQQSRILIPLRKPLEAIGAEVVFDEQAETITATKDGQVVVIEIGHKNFTVNGERKEMDTQAVIKDGRTYIPVRAVFEAFAYTVDWHAVSQTVYLDQMTQEVPTDAEV